MRRRQGEAKTLNGSSRETGKDLVRARAKVYVPELPARAHGRVVDR